MKVMITGALGFVGCELLHLLSTRPDIQVYGVDNSTEAFTLRSGIFSRYTNIHLYNVDISNLKELSLIPKVDLIIHLASVVGYLTCDNCPEAAELTNIQGTNNVASLDTPVIFMSSGSVYGAIGDICTEDTQINPQTLYAVTKANGEVAIKSKVPYVIFRPATLYGLSHKVRHDLLVHTLSHDAVKNSYIKLYQPDAMRSFYTVHKIVELCVYVIDNFSKFEGNTYNIGCETGNITKRGLVNLIQQNISIKVDIIDSVDLDTRDYNVNYSKLAAVWPDYDENFASNIPSIVTYYKNWNKSFE